MVGGDPQDLKFKPRMPSGVRIGAGTTDPGERDLNCSTVEGTYTEVGQNCLLMACCHVAHDCVVGNEVVIANAVLLAGHVHVGDRAILGGAALLHQFIRVGDGAMVGGRLALTMDIPPFTMASERDELVGLNLIGLRRRGMEPAAIEELKKAFQAVYRPGQPPGERGRGAHVGRVRGAGIPALPRIFLGGQAAGSSGGGAGRPGPAGGVTG